MMGSNKPRCRGPVLGVIKVVMSSSAALGLVLGIMATAGNIALAHGNPSGEAKATLGAATVTITYGRPSLKGRDLMQMIQPGNLWRMGADIPTSIESTAALDFGGTRVPKGKYILLARYLAPGQWTLVVSSQDRLHYEPSTKLAEIPMQIQQGQSPVEEMSIRLSAKGKNGTLELAWGAYRLTAAFSAVE